MEQVVTWCLPESLLSLAFPLLLLLTNQCHVLGEQGEQETTRR